ncbi:outer membrane protein Iml2/Tetratricopeptide repeat protein 39 [Pyrenochaeta sp. MPI-SDFR-AT-0127]|nr:outer membrane protein Iml2/Tetratricopeptide repeat protein 39 [Pyrenochaeta sp. MPI-SDFR-AT-0127]
MLKVGGWLKGHTPVHTKSLNALDELAQIQDAMSAVTHIMNDDIETAEDLLSKGSSPFHQLGVGVCTFIRATLGFEQEVMREAANALSQAENSAYEQQRRAHRDSNAYQSPIFPPGTEYAVCQAESQLMSAIVGVLNESLTEAIKSFYKLRKAYLTLESVMENEKKFLKERSMSSVNSARSGTSSRAASVRSNQGGSALKTPRPPTSVGRSAAASTSSLKGNHMDEKVPSKAVTPDSGKIAKNDDSDDDFDFVDAEEDRKGDETPIEYLGHINVPTEKGATIQLDTSRKTLDIKASTAPDLPTIENNPSSSVPKAIEDFEHLTLADREDPEADIGAFSDHPVDIFILSGSNFCFGMLLLLLSFIPPSFATLLKIVGFKGDRERGMQMLWQATKFHNIHGAMAGVVLSGYLNGFTNFCDILPTTGDGAYPKERCTALLVAMRERYPKSHLWLLEEARMLASDKELEKAVQFIKDAGESPLKQLEALSWFERSLNNMYMHDYENTASSFEICVTLNNWSHGLYYFICGASFVELYRRNKSTDPSAAKKYAVKAEGFFKQVIPNTGKKKFMARQLPFDVFVIRKIQKWEARAKDWNCDFVDAVGVSPLEEMIYFWNGYKRMRDDHLQVSLDNLAWSESSANPHWEKEDLDERSILVILRAATLRNMNRTAEAKQLIEKNILPVDRALFKGHLKDNWTAPCARYEMGANLWREADADGNPESHAQVLDECRDWLDEVTKWDGFDLDARIGMKITTGKETLRKLGVQC